MTESHFIKTLVDEESATITQTVHRGIIEISRAVMHTQDAEIAKGLMLLGWTPPTNGATNPPTDECKCHGWCCADVREMLAGNGHHPNCEHYADRTPWASPQEAEFGRLMWQHILNHMPEFLGDEWSEDVMPLAEKAGLCNRVIYDPAIHGEIEDVEPGDMIWWWGEEETLTQ